MTAALAAALLTPDSLPIRYITTHGVTAARGPATSSRPEGRLLAAKRYSPTEHSWYVSIPARPDEKTTVCVIYTETEDEATRVLVAVAGERL